MKTMARGNCREVGPGPAGPRTNPPVTIVHVGVIGMTLR